MIESHLNEVRRCYPDLAVRSSRLNTDGQNNDVLVLNESLVFRFPRNRKAAAALEREVAVLQAIGERLPLRVPHPEFIRLGDEERGRGFAGYELIPGVPLSLELFATIDDERTLDRIANQLGSFLRALHSIDADQFAATPLPLEDDLAYWDQLYVRIRQHLFAHMSEDGRLRVARQFDELLENPRQFAFEPALRHGDFGTDNILFDPEARRISGILDFGSVALGDPALDVAALSRFGDTFLARCARSYPAIVAMFPRARFYVGTFALQEALYGADHDDPVALEEGLAGYRE